MSEDIVILKFASMDQWHFLTGSYDSSLKTIKQPFQKAGLTCYVVHFWIFSIVFSDRNSLKFAQHQEMLAKREEQSSIAQSSLACQISDVVDIKSLHF